MYTLSFGDVGNMYVFGPTNETKLKVNDNMYNLILQGPKKYGDDGCLSYVFGILFPLREYDYIGGENCDTGRIGFLDTSKNLETIWVDAGSSTMGNEVHVHYKKGYGIDGIIIDANHFFGDSE